MEAWPASCCTRQPTIPPAGVSLVVPSAYVPLVTGSHDFLRSFNQFVRAHRNIGWTIPVFTLEDHDNIGEKLIRGPVNHGDACGISRVAEHMHLMADMENL